MRLIIRGKRHLEIPERLKEYIEGKIKKFEERLPGPTILDITLSDELGPKGGKDKEVDLNLTLPGEKHTLHFVEKTEDFYQSFDLVVEKLERQLRRYKEKRSYQDWSE